VIVLIDLGRAGISHLQRLPASITRAAILRRQRRGSSQRKTVGRRRWTARPCL